MKRGKFEKVRPRKNITGLVLVLALTLILIVGGVTAAFALRDTTAQVKEQLEKAEVTCTVNDDWSVTNTGNIPALIRVRVIVNLTKEDTLVPGDVPAYTVGSGWVQIGDYLYYEGIVNFEDGQNTTSPAIRFPGAGEQSTRVTVLADAIQATPDAAARQAWGVSYAEGGWS